MKIVLRVLQSIFNYMSDMVEFSSQYSWELKKGTQHIYNKSLQNILDILMIS